MRKPRRMMQSDYRAAGRGLARDMAEADARLAGEPGYPDAAVRLTQLVRNNELGDVRIMDYGKDSKTRYRVAAFLPGRDVVVEGDTPKTEPEREDWCTAVEEAADFFSIYVADAKLYGWVEAST